MLLTTPLLVTVGLSMTTPLVLLGKMALLWKIPGTLYWIGAALVFGAFFLIHWESEPETSEKELIVLNNQAISLEFNDGGYKRVLDYATRSPRSNRYSYPKPEDIVWK